VGKRDFEQTVLKTTSRRSRGLVHQIRCATWGGFIIID